MDSVGARGMGRKFAIALTVALVFLGVAYAVSMATYWRDSAMPMAQFPNIVRWIDTLQRIPAWADPWPA